MKFACDSCQAEFLIADEKVGRRGVKVRCKRCSHVIIVRPTPESMSNLNDANDLEPDADESAMPPLLEDNSGESVLNSGDNIPTEMEGSAQGQEPVEEDKQESHVAFSGEATQVTPAPQATVPMTSPADAGQDPGPQLQADETPDAIVAGDESPASLASPQIDNEEAAFADAGGFEPGDASDEFDQQLEGAFAQMFDDAASGGIFPDDDDDEEEQLTDIQAQSDVIPGFENSDFSSPLSPSLLGMAEDEEQFVSDTIAESQAQVQIWFLAVGDENVGPLSLAELRNYFDRGEMDGASLVWNEDMPDWEHASQVPALEALFDAPVPSLAADGLVAEPGLFAAYQAAPMSHQADAPSPLELGGSPLDGVFGSSSLEDLPPPADDGWTPGAASALASLVEAELQRPDDAGALVQESSPVESPQMPALPMEEGGFGSEMPAPAALFAVPNGGANDAGATPAMASSNLVSAAPAHPAILAAAPYGAPVAAARPVWQYLAMGLTVIGVAALAKIAFFGPAPVAAVPQAQRVDTAAPAPVPASPPPSMNPSTVSPTTTVASNALTGAVASADVPAAPATALAQATAVSAGAAVASPPLVPAPAVAPAPASAPPSEAKTKKAKKTRAARSAPPKPVPEPPKVVAAAESKAAPPEPEKEEERPARASRKQSNPNCDPVLDFDCNEAPKKSRTARSGGATKPSLSRDDVLIVVKKNLSGVHGCFDTHGGKGPVKMQWRIAKSGRTKKVKVLSGKYQDTPLGSCIQDKIRGWRFPKYSGKAPPPVTIPFKARS